MNIAMFTNTYIPHVGGVARSVKTLEDACRKHGHQVLVVAAEFDGAEPSRDVLRVPAIQNFNGSDFSVRLPFATQIRDRIQAFKPDLIHSHHPFLLGDTALRTAWIEQIPVLFTHHTLYEHFTHYVPLDSPALKRVAIQLATEYGNLCDLVIAPSASIAGLLRERGVISPIHTIPTGIDTGFFASGSGSRFRRKWNIPAGSKIIGHVGRLAHEKNLRLLAQSVAACLAGDPDTEFLVVGCGGALDEMLSILNGAASPSQTHAVGIQTGTDLADAYAAMDCFVFASQCETQGLVVAEAMAAGLPVVALDGPGVREILSDGRNGRLLPANATAPQFSKAIRDLLHDPLTSQRCSLQAQEDASLYSTSRCTAEVMRCYENLIRSYQPRIDPDTRPWDRLLHGIGIEWELLVEKMAAAAAAVIPTPATRTHLE